MSRVPLREGDYIALQRMVKNNFLSLKIRMWAKVLLYMNEEGARVYAVAKRMGISGGTVLRVLERYRIGGLNALVDTSVKVQGLEYNEDIGFSKVRRRN